MAIPESQLKTWSAQGAIKQSRDTYATIKTTLEDSKAPYSARSYDPPFLQGSYGNDTNVYSDSDVDVVLKLDAIYYKDLSRLTPAGRELYDKSSGGAAAYDHFSFKKEVVSWLTTKYGALVKPGKKAVFIKGDGNRRDVDVLVAADFRRYFSYELNKTNDFIDGICFFLPDNTRVENYPKRHSANCTEKHKATNEWFKPTVRVFKNMRNRMIERGELAEGIAPSYYLEGMLYNVPPDKFGKTCEDTFVNCYNWILQNDSTQFVCASRMHWLIRDNEQTSWSLANFKTYIDAAKVHWQKG